MSGTPFDPGSVSAGDLLKGVDPQTLTAGRRELSQIRLDAQRDLLRQNIKRFTRILVTEEGIIYDGNHGVRAAAEADVAVDVEVVAAVGTAFGDIMHVPVVAR